MGEVIEMNGRGRIVIPRRVREKLGLVRGSILVMEQYGKSIILRKVELRELDSEEGPKKANREKNGKQMKQFLS